MPHSYDQAGYQRFNQRFFLVIGGSRITAPGWPSGTSWMTQRWPRSAWAPPRPSSSAMDGGWMEVDAMGKSQETWRFLAGFSGKRHGEKQVLLGKAWEKQVLLGKTWEKLWEIMEKLWKIIYEWRFLAGKTIEIIGENFGPLKIDYWRSEDEQQFWNWGIFHRKKQQSSKESYRISRII